MVILEMTEEKAPRTIKDYLQLYSNRVEPEALSPEEQIDSIIRSLTNEALRYGITPERRRDIEALSSLQFRPQGRF